MCPICSNISCSCTISTYILKANFIYLRHRLRMPSEEIAFTARPKIKSQSQIYRYGQSIFYLPHRPKISGFFDLCLHWVVLATPARTHYFYCNVRNSSMSRLAAHFQFFRRLMKGKFDVYVLN